MGVEASARKEGCEFGRDGERGDAGRAADAGAEFTQGEDAHAPDECGGGVCDEALLGEADGEGDVGDDAACVGGAGVTVEARGDVDGEDASVGGLAEVVDGAGECGDGFAEWAFGTDAEEAVDDDEWTACGAQEGSGVVAVAACGFAEFGGDVFGPLLFVKGGDEADFPACGSEVAGCDECIAAVVPFSKNGEADAGPGEKLADSTRDLQPGFLHEDFRQDTGGECLFLDGLHGRDTENHRTAVRKKWAARDGLSVNSANACCDSFGEPLAIAGTRDVAGFPTVGEEAKFAEHGGHPRVAQDAEAPTAHTAIFFARGTEDAAVDALREPGAGAARRVVGLDAVGIGVGCSIKMNAHKHGAVLVAIGDGRPLTEFDKVVSAPRHHGAVASAAQGGIQPARHVERVSFFLQSLAGHPADVMAPVPSVDDHHRLADRQLRKEKQGAEKPHQKERVHVWGN